MSNRENMEIADFLKKRAEEVHWLAAAVSSKH